jgi:hypothetical protein
MPHRSKFLPFKLIQNIFVCFFDKKALKNGPLKRRGGSPIFLSRSISNIIDWRGTGEQTEISSNIPFQKMKNIFKNHIIYMLNCGFPLQDKIMVGPKLKCQIHSQF